MNVPRAVLRQQPRADANAVTLGTIRQWTILDQCFLSVGLQKDRKILGRDQSSVKEYYQAFSGTYVALRNASQAF
jgi:hypothetical protein